MCKDWNERVKKLTWLDISLTKLSVLFATIIIVKLFPQLLTIRSRVLIVLTIVCVAKPFYNLWFKK